MTSKYQMHASGPVGDDGQFTKDGEQVHVNVIAFGTGARKRYVLSRGAAMNLYLSLADVLGQPQ